MDFVSKYSKGDKSGHLTLTPLIVTHETLLYSI